MSLSIGSIIENKYRVVRLIGEGGMGAVYEAENVSISRRVAIKVLHAAAASNQEVVARFEREAQAAGKIGSDHILEVLDLGTLANGDRFMVMEFLAGQSLGERLEKEPILSAAVLVPIMMQVLKGLDAAHRARIIHRDLKPDNIFILTEKAGHADFVKLIDFGISKFQSTAEMRMTQTGAVMGTPYYMSPEQAKGVRDIDGRVDIYALGVIMYEALTGAVPFDGENFNELLFQIVLNDAPDVATKIAPEALFLAPIVKKAMAKEPDQRFSNAQEFATALSEVANEAGIAVEGGRSSMVSVNGDLASYLAANTDGVAKARAASQPNFSEGNQGKAAQSAYGSTAMDWERSGDDALKASLNKNQLKPVWLAGGALLLGAAVAVFAFAGNDKATPVEEKPVLGAPAEDIAASSKSAEEVAKLAEIEMRKKVEAQFAAEQLEAKKKTEAARLAEEAKLAEVASQTAAAKPQNSPKPAPRRAVAAPAPAPTPAPAPAPAPVVSKPATPKPPVDELGY